MNKNPLGQSIDMQDSEVVDVLNNQTCELKFPLTFNAKFDSGTPLDAPPIKFQIAFRNE